MQDSQEMKDIPLKEFPRLSTLRSSQPSKEGQEEPKPKEVNKDKDTEISQRRETSTAKPIKPEKSHGSGNSKEQKLGRGNSESKFKNVVSKGKEWLDHSNSDNLSFVATMAAASAVIILVIYVFYNYALTN